MQLLSISHSQYLIAKTSPHDFLDGFVESRSPGALSLRLLNNESHSLRIFEAPVDWDSFLVGEPVAFHRIAGILATNSTWISVKELIIDTV